MPHGDRTGPRGQGPITGRGVGFCNRYDMAGYANRGVVNLAGGSRYMSNRGGRGHRHWYYATGLRGWMRGERRFPLSHRGASTVQPAISRREELEMLRDEAGYFNQALEGIKERISRLETRSDTEVEQTGG